MSHLISFSTLKFPMIEDDASGDAQLEGTVDLGEGNYHVDWMMRDRTESVCSSNWDMEAVLAPKDREMHLEIRREPWNRCTKSSSWMSLR